MALMGGLAWECELLHQWTQSRQWATGAFGAPKAVKKNALEMVGLETMLLMNSACNAVPHLATFRQTPKSVCWALPRYSSGQCMQHQYEWLPPWEHGLGPALRAHQTVPEDVPAQDQREARWLSGAGGPHGNGQSSRISCRSHQRSCKHAGGPAGIACRPGTCRY